MRHVISVEVENTPGVLARVAGLFSARGYNIESLAVGETELPERSRMTIAVSGDSRVIEQIRKQLNKLIDTVKVVDLTREAVVERDRPTREHCGRANIENPDHRHRGLLGAGYRRPGRRSTTYQQDEIPTPHRSPQTEDQRIHHSTQ